MMLCSITMGIGTSVGGEPIIKSVGMDMVKLEKYQGFAADLASSLCLLVMTLLGIPVSTTHTKTSAIMGVGGYYMGLNMSGSFSSGCWINGYGWIAVALVIFANWNPAMAILGTFVFGFFSTLRVSGSSLAAAFPAALGWLAKVPTQLYQALPFLITAVVLVATSVRKREGSGCPAALGLNYFREDRLI